MEKAKSTKSFDNTTFRNFTLLFELCLGLLTASCLLTCVFTWVPLAVRIAADHLGGNLAAFLFCNAVIILVLFLKNSETASSPPPPRPDLYDEFVAVSQARRSSGEASPAPEDKHVMSSASGSCSVSVSGEEAEKTEHALFLKTECSVQSPARKVCGRTKSEKFGVGEKGERELRRSETDNGRRKAAEAVEELSNEEFRLKIESFIAAQKCNLMKEHKCTDMVKL